MTRGTKPEMLSAAPDKGIACSGRQHECIVSYSWSGDLPLPPLPLQANPGPFAFGGLPNYSKMTKLCDNAMRAAVLAVTALVAGDAGGERGLLACSQAAGAATSPVLKARGNFK